MKRQSTKRKPKPKVDKKEVIEGTLIDSPKGIVHCWYNESDKPLRVLVNKVPKPTNSTKIL